jgi:hypothetical protein
MAINKNTRAKDFMTPPEETGTKDYDGWRRIMSAALSGYF